MLGISAEKLIRFERLLPSAQHALDAPKARLGDVEWYPTLPAKAGVLASRLIRNHPLPDGNKRVAYLCLREFVERNGRHWDSSDPDDAVEAVVGVTTRRITEEEFIAWVGARVR